MEGKAIKYSNSWPSAFVIVGRNSNSAARSVIADQLA